MANSIDQLTSGVLTQAFTGFDFTQNLGSWRRLGRTSGRSDNQFQTFRNEGDLRPFPDFTQDIENALTVGTLIGMSQRRANYSILQTDFVEIIDIRSVNSGANREVDVQFFPGETGQGLPTLHTERASFNWAFSPAGQQEGDVTSHRNFNFDSTVTLTGLNNASSLGTDSEGRIIIGRGGGNVTEQNTFPTTPTVGDIHIQTEDLGAVMTSGFLPVRNASNAIVTINRYGCSGNRCSLNDAMPPVANGVAYNLVEHGFANLQISENRNNITPPLGVAANPLELAWRTPGAGDTWTSIGNVGDSSRNGNTTRLRMTIATSAEFSARFDGIPAGAELGYRAAAPINTPALNAGTYVFGGTDGNGNPDWNLISSNSSSTTSDTFSLRVENSDASDTIDYTNNTVNKFRFGSGIIAAADPTGTDDNDVLISVPSSSSYHDSDVRLNEGSTTLTENALVRSEITEGVTSFTINRVADDLAWELGDYGHAFTENGTSSFNFRVTAYDASANTLTVIVERIVETTENPNFGWNINIGNLSYPGLRVTQELSASVEDVDNIIFDNRHFSVSDRGNGDVEIVATSALSGGVDIREDNTTVLASAGILNFGAGFNVATEGTGTADERATVTLDNSTVPGKHKHTQTTAATQWDVMHNLNEMHPAITVWDNTGMGEVIIPDQIISTGLNTLTIHFPVAVAGRATLIG